MKKGIEISLNTVIIAAIALIVLVVLVVIFTNYSGKLTHGISGCGAKGGTPTSCTRTADECINQGGKYRGDCIFYDSNGEKTEYKNQVCCVFD